MVIKPIKAVASEKSLVHKLRGSVFKDKPTIVLVFEGRLHQCWTWGGLVTSAFFVKLSSIFHNIFGQGHGPAQKYCQGESGYWRVGERIKRKQTDTK